jgi:hypothetical protein
MGSAVLGASLSNAAAVDISAAVLQGGIAGRVIIAGGFERPKPLPVFKNRTFCGPTVPNETLIVDADGGLQNAAVLLRPRGARPAVRPGRLVLNNEQCAFRPHVQIGVVGSELLLKNSDPILHTVHARMGRETLFNVGLPKWRQVSQRLGRAGIVRIDCDVLHTWMSAAIVVADTPYFAVTDAAGRFHIGGLRDGLYDMEIWHERLGSRRRVINVAPDATVNVEIIYSPSETR